MSDVIALLAQKGIVCSDQQKKAILSGERDTLLLAVPGSGKTTVLVSRIAQMLLYEGYRPNEIIALTYNRAAAKDIGIRFDAIFGEFLAAKPRFSTVHSLCYTVLQQYSTVYHKQMPKLLDGSSVELRPQTYLREILSRYSDSFLTAEQIDDSLQKLGQAVNLMFPADLMQTREHGCTLQTLYDQYAACKKERGLMDYDDMQLFALQILTRLPAFLGRMMAGKKWIFLDEAQDASLLQHRLIALLAKGRHVFFVGDEDQTIYDFRGASPNELLQFQKSYPDGQLLRLETNYRCPNDLVSAADVLIRYNQGRYPKNMTAFRKEQDSIRIIPLQNFSAQTEAVVQALKSLPNGQTAAVLASHNVSLLPIAKRLTASGIAYRRKDSDFRFSQNPAIRSFTRILEYALQPKSKECFLETAKILHFRKADALKMEEYLLRFPNGFYAGLVCDLNGYAKKRATEVANGISLLQKQGGKQIYQTVMKQIGLEVCLVGKGKGFDELPAGTALALFYLRSIAESAKDAVHFHSLLQQTKEFEESSQDDMRAAVTLSTIHGAKGLEFDQVYLLDIIEGCMPALLPSDADPKQKKENLEQQTRLFYVAATRAKMRLTLYTAPAYFEKNVTPSRFIQRLQPQIHGGRIRHKAFGIGEVLSSDGKLAKVAFPAGIKTIELEYCIKQGIVARILGEQPPVKIKERKKIK